MSKQAYKEQIIMVRNFPAHVGGYDAELPEKKCGERDNHGKDCFRDGWTCAVNAINDRITEMQQRTPEPDDSFPGLPGVEGPFTALNKLLAHARGEKDADWPALPEGLPSVPGEGYVYVGRGAESDEPVCLLIFHPGTDDRWHSIIPQNAGRCPSLHYAVHRNDLHKVRRKS